MGVCGYACVRACVRTCVCVSGWVRGWARVCVCMCVVWMAGLVGGGTEVPERVGRWYVLHYIVHTLCAGFRDRCSTHLHL